MRFYSAYQRGDVCKVIADWLSDTGVQAWDYEKECPSHITWAEVNKSPENNKLSSAQVVLLTLLLDVWTSGNRTYVMDLGYLDEDKREAVGDLIAACCSRNVRAKVEKWLDDNEPGGDTATATQGKDKEQ